MVASEEALPVSRAANDPHVTARGSHDMTDALFSPEDVADKQTLPVMTEQTQLLFTADVRAMCVCCDVLCASTVHGKYLVGEKLANLRNRELFA